MSLIFIYYIMYRNIISF